MLIHEVCSSLSKAKIPYAIVGGYAVALHGAVRGTVDVDVVISWTLANLKKVEKTLNEMGLISLLPINAENLFHFKDEYIEKRNLIAWNFYDPKNLSRQVDIIVTYNLKTGQTKTIKTSKGEIKILAKQELIAMKRASGRPQDIEDINALEKL